MSATASQLTADPKVIIHPPCAQWLELLHQQPQGTLFNRSLEEWRRLVRVELRLDPHRLIIATGHQTLLWHPGILAKYLVVDAFAKQHALATANLIVDQHAEGFGDFEAPVHRDDGALAARRVELCRPRPRKNVPMGRHESFTPPRPPEHFPGALPSVNAGVQQIFEAVYAHRNAPSAALQMADALADLMNPWVSPMINVTSTALIGSSLAKAMLRAMAEDPRRCADCYNRAVAAVPEGGLQPMMIRDDYVELPLWRIRSGGDGRRMHAYDNDVINVVEGHAEIDLMPRALFMTALVRLGMCDLFIHGTGGARYDRAMEIWIKDWLSVEVGSIAVTTADLRLPLMRDDASSAGVPEAIQRARRLFHDPEPIGRRDTARQIKRKWLVRIDSLPRNSSERKAAFLAMHGELDRLRQSNPQVNDARREVEAAKRAVSDAEIACRRDWPFALYPREMIGDLAMRMSKCAVQATA